MFFDQIHWFFLLKKREKLLHAKVSHIFSTKNNGLGCEKVFIISFWDDTAHLWCRKNVNVGSDYSEQKFWSGPTMFVIIISLTNIAYRPSCILVLLERLRQILEFLRYRLHRLFFVRSTFPLIGNTNAPFLIHLPSGFQHLLNTFARPIGTCSTTAQLHG